MDMITRLVRLTWTALPLLLVAIFVFDVAGLRTLAVHSLATQFADSVIKNVTK